jgi:hypothetical protein
MEVIELIGLKTALYDDIRTNVLSCIELYETNVVLVERNDIESILNNRYSSIPLILFANKEFYFDESQFPSALQELNSLLKDHASKEKTHNCKNCGSCKCPPKISMEKSSDA